MSDPTALFRQYERDFSEKAVDIGTKLDKLASCSSSDAHRSLVAALEAGIREAEGLVQRMELEARSMPASDMAWPMSRAKQCRAEVGSLQQRLQRAASTAGAVSSARAQWGLAGAAGGSTSLSQAAQQRERALAASARLQHTSERLKLGQQQLLEAEATGQSVLAELHRQRETIEESQRMLDGAGQELKQSEGLLRAMVRRTKWLFG